jgi:hypothetical protein
LLADLSQLIRIIRSSFQSVLKVVKVLNDHTIPALYTKQYTISFANWTIAELELIMVVHNLGSGRTVEEDQGGEDGGWVGPVAAPGKLSYPIFQVFHKMADSHN